MINISLYNNAFDEKGKNMIAYDLFLEGIRSGKWQDIVLPLRAIADDEKRSVAKKKAPAVTVSGTFKERNDKSLITHSGYIVIDIDNVDDVNETKSILCCDKYVAAAFVSISGRGLCAIFKINPAKHRESFQGISEYLYTNYKIVCDPTSINVSRMRFVSYDPHLFQNDEAEKFTTYPKSKPPKKVEKTIFATNDFEAILEQIQGRHLNLCDNYHEWLRIGFAFAHHFGERGRYYFHTVSQYSAKYDGNAADRQYTTCMRNKADNVVTIATFYYYCKQAGIKVYSERTRKIAYSASNGKKGGLSAAQVAENLLKFEDIEDAKDVIDQVWQNDIEVQGEDCLIDQVELWMRQNYDLQRNEITRYIENKGVIIKQKDFNTIFIKGKKLFDKINYEIIDRLINSDFVDEYNPFQRFFEAHKDITTTGRIEALFASVKTKDSDYLLHFGRKWLLGIISAIHGQHSPLMLVLSGDKQGTGKTEFFRRLLPKELQCYYAESKLDAGKDDEILMTQKLLIMDDEMGGKSKKESKRLKELTSKQMFSLREPYGRNNVDLNRLAVLCGTTNDNEILNDPTGNRRIIPIHVESIDHPAYNRVDKTALMMEAYSIWKTGEVWQLNQHDINYLGQDNKSFEVTSLEGELIQKHFEPADGHHGTEWLTASDIKVYIETLTHQKLLLNKIGQELKRFGYKQVVKLMEERQTRRVYGVCKLNSPEDVTSHLRAPF